MVSILTDRGGSSFLTVFAILLCGTLLSAVFVMKATQLTKLSDRYPDSIYFPSSPSGGPAISELEAALAPQIDCVTTLWANRFRQRLAVGDNVMLLANVGYENHTPGKYYDINRTGEQPLVGTGSDGTSITLSNGSTYQVKAKWTRLEYVNGANEHEFEISARNAAGQFEKVFSFICPRKCPSNMPQPCWGP